MLRRWGKYKNIVFEISVQMLQEKLKIWLGYSLEIVSDRYMQNQMQLLLCKSCYYGNSNESG